MSNRRPLKLNPIESFQEKKENKEQNDIHTMKPHQKDRPTKQKKTVTYGLEAN